MSALCILVFAVTLLVLPQSAWPQNERLLAEIRRTADGIPHIRASSWHGLGEGIGYVQAQDALCTLAEAFVTYEGRRSWFFGVEEKPALDSSLGQPRNIDLDFFVRAFADDVLVNRFRKEQPADLKQLIDGFAVGYNSFLREARSHPDQYAYRICLNAEWVREISAADVYRRMFIVQFMAGYSQFLAEIVNAMPNGKQVDNAEGLKSLRARLVNNLGNDDTLGSNVIAWGQRATGGDGAVLFGNPHWYWGGPDRFYQMHLTIPGKLNVAGVSFLGIPIVMIGFNDHVAWSHTVSRARRFGLFELTLDPTDPKRYLVDGVSEPMQARQVHVEVRDADGQIRQETRTLYSTRYGPIVDLGHQNAALGWSDQHAIVIRDVNAKNWRVFRNFLAWNRATSLNEFIAIQRKEAAMPWVNTVAIGKGDGRVWYADIGALPNVSDELRESCATPTTKTFARIDTRTPFLDGSRSVCNWQNDPKAAQPGAMPASKQPSLLREDYVANMNDSHWLNNLSQPLEGYATLIGEERQPLRIRARLGHQMAIALLQAGMSSSGELTQVVMRDVLKPRVYSAEQFKDALLDQACSRANHENGDLIRACHILRNWGNTGETDDRGTLLWEAFWGEVQKIPDAELYKVPFDINAPLTTPTAPVLPEHLATQALTEAIKTLIAQGIPLDAPLGNHRFVRSDGRQWPIYGGCGYIGYFTTACSGGSHEIGANAVSNSYLQVVHFTDQGVEAYTLLAHGQDELAVSNGRGSAPVIRYTKKNWLRFPFHETEIKQELP